MMDNIENSREWVGVVKKYATPVLLKSIWQLINSLLPYIVLWYLAYLSLSISYLTTLGICILASGFLVRIFIIFHDCGHGSFFRNKKANRFIGTILGSLVFTPYDRWHQTHATHHATVGNLDKRGDGDVWTLTVEEFMALPKGRKRLYRVFRHPVVLFGIGPFFLFVLWFRFTKKVMDAKEKRSIYICNLIMIIYVSGLILLMGWKAFLIIQLPVSYIATAAGVWLFYVQHQYTDVIWTRQDDWDYKTMAMEGSSYLRFPKILQWFSGNIGFHHIHHLSPMIPNYNLEKCQKENSMFDSIKPVTFIPSLKTMSLRLWDEKNGRIISFKQLRQQAEHSD
jgi:omega-6 fatty acid desaturase (delta-12 desaturase)